MPEKSPGPWNKTFYIPPCQKKLASGGSPGLAPGSRISGMGEFKRSHSGDRKIFPAFGNAKVLHPGPEESGRLFRHGRGKKATVRTSCGNINSFNSHATTPARERLTAAETLTRACVKTRA
jgi:hypothetical protein